MSWSRTSQWSAGVRSNMVTCPRCSAVETRAIDRGEGRHCIHCPRRGGGRLDAREHPLHCDVIIINFLPWCAASQQLREARKFEAESLDHSQAPVAPCPGGGSCPPTPFTRGGAYPAPPQSVPSAYPPPGYGDQPPAYGRRDPRHPCTGRRGLPSQPF
jgi:hypothetical protein